MGEQAGPRDRHDGSRRFSGVPYLARLSRINKLNNSTADTVLLVIAFT